MSVLAERSVFLDIIFIVVVLVLLMCAPKFPKFWRFLHFDFSKWFKAKTEPKEHDRERKQ